MPKLLISNLILFYHTVDNIPSSKTNPFFFLVCRQSYFLADVIIVSFTYFMMLSPILNVQLDEK